MVNNAVFGDHASKGGIFEQYDIRIRVCSVHKEVCTRPENGAITFEQLQMKNPIATLSKSMYGWKKKNAYRARNKKYSPAHCIDDLTVNTNPSILGTCDIQQI